MHEVYITQNMLYHNKFRFNLMGIVGIPVFLKAMGFCIENIPAVLLEEIETHILPDINNST